MKNLQKIQWAFIVIFALAVLLRVYPAYLNRDANDDHFEVIEIIAYENRIPGKEDLACLQCYHPKLYHYTAAKLVNLFSAHPGADLKIIAQELSALAGILTLVFVSFFLQKLPLRENVRLATFLLTALNPSLIGINIQATNDSFVILFSTSALYFLFRFLEKQQLASFWLMTLSVILASLSKGSGLIILLGVIVVFLIKMGANLRAPETLKRFALLLGLFLVTSFFFLATFGPYYDYYQTYGSPIVINKEKSPFPHFFQQTYVGGKTGIVSIFDGYFTFHPIDLIQAPFLDRESSEGSYSPSRTSLWTELYARANFIQYQGRPRDWYTKLASPVYNIGSVISFLALLPLALFLVGLFLVTRNSIRSLWKNGLPSFAQENTWMFTFFFWTAWLFIIKFTLDYREYSAMKPIYIYPMLLSFVFVFASGMNYVTDYVTKKGNRALSLGIFAILFILATFYVVDIWYLVQKLA